MKGGKIEGLMTEILFLRTPTGIGAPIIKGPNEVAPNKGPIQIKGPIQTRGPHGQRAHTYKGPIQTKDPYR